MFPQTFEPTVSLTGYFSASPDASIRQLTWYTPAGQLTHTGDDGLPQVSHGEGGGGAADMLISAQILTSRDIETAPAGLILGICMAYAISVRHYFRVNGEPRVSERP